MANPIPVDWIEQLNDYYCGPASAAMIAKGAGAHTPSGVVTDGDWQRLLWTEIKDLTTGPPRPDEAKSSGGYIEEFDRQQCYLCGEDDEAEWYCWAATPQAMMDLLNKHVPSQDMIIVRTPSIDPVDIVDAVLKSIDRDVPAAVATGDETHWLVAHGYAVQRKATGVRFGGRNIKGVYVRDPNAAVPPGGLDLIPIDEFKEQYLGFVTCGSDDDTDNVIAIVRP